jgi:hypothetical protein
MGIVPGIATWAVPQHAVGGVGKRLSNVRRLAVRRARRQLSVVLRCSAANPIALRVRADEVDAAALQ